MDFSFSKDFSIIGNKLKKIENGIYKLIDINKPIDNLITIDNIDYFFISLSEKGNKGGNSIILKLYDAQSFDTEDIEYGDPDCILKVSKNPLRPNPDKNNLRFKREIDALIECKGKGYQNVITIYNHGVCKIFNDSKKKYSDYQYYTMEYAEFDLKSYIEEKHYKLNLDEKLSLCISISEGLNELKKLGYYHRDIKPDNIFITQGDHWKIGDLGLLDNQNTDCLDDIAEFVGPKGWMTPEAMNKYLCEGKGYAFKHNCTIDHQSDIFQLGKVFWYIFQYNAPIGTVKENDFLVREQGIYPVIKTMLNYSKEKRYKSIEDIIALLKLLEAKLLKLAIA